MPHLQEVLWIGLLVVFAGGSLATVWTGQLKDRQLRQQLRDSARIVAETLDPQDIVAVAGALGNPALHIPALKAYERLRQQCMGFVNVQERPCYIYILGQRTNEIVFYLDTEPDATRPAALRSPGYKAAAKPGEPYKDAPPELHWAFATGKNRTTTRPYTDEWGTYMSSFAPIWVPDSGPPLCVVGYDVDASNWYSQLAQPRLVPIAFSLLLAGLLSSFLVIRERDENAKSRMLRALADRQAVLDAASEVAIIAFTPDGLVTVFNRGAEKMLGHAAAEVIGRQDILRFHLESEIAERAAELSRVHNRPLGGRQVLTEVPLRKGAEQREWTFRRKDGSRFPVSLAVTATRDQAGAVTGFLGVAVDLTARKHAEQELREQERFVSAVAETSPDFLSVFDFREMRTVYTNRRVADLISLPAEATASLEENWLKSLAHPEDQPRLRDHLERIRKAADGEVADIEFRLRTRSGEYRWFQSRDTVFRRDGQGEVVQVLSVAQDITQIKEAEVTRNHLEAQLRQSQKMEAVGQLAAGVAHDFNNLLTVIQGNASLLQEGHSDEAALFCEQILEAARRATTLTQQLLLFSRRQVPQRQLLNLGEVISRLSEMLQRLLGEHIRMEWGCDAGLPSVSADPGMIEQLVLNLAVNARDAMPGGGTISLSLRALNLDAAAAGRHPKARPGRFVCLTVADTGCGIDPKTLPRIFEPFFTTKDLGKGTGLGLATAYGIVEQHQGWIEVTTGLNKGSTFHIYLPATEGQPTAPTANSAPRLRPGQNETILLVEDELAVLTFAERVLRRGGYRVLAATTGAEALELWPRHKDQIQLLVSDHLMPEGMTGLELATRLKSEKPQLKAILTSGYCMEAEALASGTSDILAAFLAKPFTPEALLQAVQEALGAPASPGRGLPQTSPAA